MGIYIDSIKMQGDYTRYLEVTKDGKVYAPFVKGGTVMRIKYANGEPVKAVEIDIVRCKNCKHWLQMDGKCFPNADVNDFCSNGERRDK